MECDRCAMTDPGGGAAVLSWSRAVVDGETRWLCPDCSRAHARDIEARLAPEWWS